jgi:hypothetical protein
MEVAKTNNGKWHPGQSGNVNGRPVGSRQQFSGAFLRDLADVWQEHGRQTMVDTAKANPSVFFATCARLIPTDVKVTVQQSLPGGLDHEDWAIMLDVIGAVKEALPAARDRKPGQVLGHVLDALHAYVATPLLDATT